MTLGSGLAGTPSLSVLAKHELTVGGYIDLILERHLEENQEEINGLLRKEIDDWNM